jgi:hypothetical protein
MAKTYVFKATDKGIIGKAFEMAIKDSLNRKNADKVSPCGTCDFRYNRKAYDTKQNGSVLKYDGVNGYVRGSSRVIYATHVAHDMAIVDDMAYISVDLKNTEFFVLDKKEFVEELERTNCMKYNAARHEVNIQTVYNYKKDAYHGKKGKVLEQWAWENCLEDDILDAILEGLD